MTRAYASRIGLMADAPNFPAAWDEVIEKVKIADELGFDWTATQLEQMEKTNTELSQFLAQHRAKVRPKAGLTNGSAEADLIGEHRADK